MRIFRKKPKALKPGQFTERWRELQKFCASRKTWPQAIMAGDELVAEALKKAKFKGKTTGERLVAAQHHLSDNEQVWLGHKLCKRLSQEEVDVRTLKKQDVAGALAGFRQALRDLGALEKSPIIEDDNG